MNFVAMETVFLGKIVIQNAISMIEDARMVVIKYAKIIIMMDVMNGEKIKYALNPKLALMDFAPRRP